MAVSITENVTSSCASRTAVLLLLATLSLCPFATADTPETSVDRFDNAVTQGVTFLLSRQEGPTKAEWPYEGVYRVREAGEHVIPIGYRVGGTALVATALLRTTADERNDEQALAMERAVNFLCQSTAHPLMQWRDYSGGYDVRGWGYIYALSFLCELQSSKAVASKQAEAVQEAIDFYAQALQEIAIPGAGGWNYSRRGPRRSAPQAPFMTGPALQALFAANVNGTPVDTDIINKALEALERSRAITGAVEYSGGRTPAAPDTHVAGSAGRMLTTETTLLLAGRGSIARVRGALDSFIAFWDELEVRRAQSGTHKGPYGVAPYYFFFAHYYAAQAIEMLPEPVQEEYRSQLHERLWQVRSEDGSWNDRVFPRTANYGTALTLLSLTMPAATPPPIWSPPGADADSD